MQLGDVEILTRSDIRGWLMAHRDDDPVLLALSGKNNANIPPVVYSQLKILRKAAKKLPQWANSGCIFTERGLEQCSSERAAALKQVSGKRCLDLTCGLGVDAAHFAQHFDEVIALEPDPVLFALGKYNIERLGLNNLTLRNSDAETWLAQYEGPGFDLIYADPDRRDEQGNRKHSPVQGKPDVLALLPKLKLLTNKLLIKASPLYDIAEAGRDFPDASCLRIVSVDGEVKELLIEIDFQQQTGTNISVCCDRQNELSCFDFNETGRTLPIISQMPGEGSFLYEPDPAFYAARTSALLMEQEFSELNARMNDPAGFYFSEKYTKSFPVAFLPYEKVLRLNQKSSESDFAGNHSSSPVAIFLFLYNKYENKPESQMEVSFTSFLP